MSAQREPEGLAAQAIAPVVAAHDELMAALWALDVRHPETTERFNRALDAYPSTAAFESARLADQKAAHV